MKAKYLWWGVGIIAAYIVYETWVQPALANNGLPAPTGGAEPNSCMGGLDFGVLDPSTW